jgi:DNA mismatch repair protein MutS
VLLSHAGLYVPARSAKVGLVDGIFARVGSGDILAKNQSTFMTEMVEMANILHNATERSFVILDELGRGTSTYDGMALAKAIVVYMCQHVGCKTLFATHYHELTQLATQLDNVENFSVSVYETDQDIVFLKKVVRGGVSKSYGIDVAKLAGVPHVITDQASIFLQELEN